MISLVRSEITRLTSRRVARVTALVILAIIVLTLGRLFLVSSNDAGPELAKAEAAAAAQRAQCEFAQQAAQNGQFEGEVGPEGFQCDQITASDFFNDPRLVARDALRDGTKAVAVGVAIFAFAIGASYVGADWGAGTMQALLFWETRRGRVLFAKAAALVSVLVAFVAFATVIVYAGLWLIALTRGTTEGATGGFHVANVLTMLRGALLVSFTGLFGFAVAGLARHSGASLFGGFVYFVIVENLLRGLRPQWERWLLAENFSAVLNKRTPLFLEQAVSGIDELGRRDVYMLSGVRGSVMLGFYLALLLGAFYLAFTRRDVT